MSTYIDIEAELSDDGVQIFFFTNLRLAEQGDEQYASVAEMAEGSAIAQTLAPIPGIEQLSITAQELAVTRDQTVDWHVTVEDVSAALRDNIKERSHAAPCVICRSPALSPAPW